jgi:dihydrofolate reductase
MTPKLSMIAAVAQNLAIGKNNQLLWHLPEDLKRFKEITKGHPVLMGQKTFESLGKPLPGRVNIVISIDPNYRAEGCVIVHSLEEALEAGKKTGSDEIFVIGGGSIYKQFLPKADKLYITKVHRDFEADVFFPPYEDRFKKIVYSRDSQQGDLEYTFLELER